MRVTARVPAAAHPTSAATYNMPEGEGLSLPLEQGSLVWSQEAQTAKVRGKGNMVPTRSMVSRL